MLLYQGLFLRPLVSLTLATLTVPLGAQLVCFDGFGEYPAGQLESGSNGTSGTGQNGGAGWGGVYDVSNGIKNLVKIEDRTSSPVNYSNGDVTILGGNRALRFYDLANGSTYAVRRPLGATFSAAAGDTLWFSVLFRTAGGSPLADQDFFQIGFDDNADASGGVPRVSIGANTTSTTSFPADYRFFARSSASANGSVFCEGIPIAAVTTYLLVGRVQPQDGTYASVSLFVNPSKLADPGPPSAEAVLPSGVSTLSHAFIRTFRLDSLDVYVFDEWHVGRDYGSVVQSLEGALRISPAAGTESAALLRWPVSLGGALLETSTDLTPESWTEVAGPFLIEGAAYQYPAPVEPEQARRFFRLRR